MPVASGLAPGPSPRGRATVGPVPLPAAARPVALVVPLANADILAPASLGRRAPATRASRGRGGGPLARAHASLVLLALRPAVVAGIHLRAALTPGARFLLLGGLRGRA